MIDAVNTLSTFMLGVFSGALLTEGMILVPYWRKMAPNDFFRLHKEMGPSLFRFFAPLTVISVLLAITAALIPLAYREVSFFRLAAGGGAALTLAIFFLYFKSANQAFADHNLENVELGPELARWSAWYWVRTVIIIFAFAVSVID